MKIKNETQIQQLELSIPNKKCRRTLVAPKRSVGGSGLSTLNSQPSTSSRRHVAPKRSAGGWFQYMRQIVDRAADFPARPVTEF